MIRMILFLAFLGLSSQSFAQKDQRITTIDYVQVLNGNRAETLHYYQHNWKLLREKAVKRKFLHSYELLETQPTEERPYQFILVSTYENQAQYDKREDNFAELIEERGPRNLLNEKQPAEFRKIVGQDKVKHWE